MAVKRGEESRKVIVIAGPNGAGKTTFALKYLPFEPACEIFVNADMIAAGLSPLAPSAAQFQAGRLMLQQIDDHARCGRSFAFETTLSGLGYARRIRQWKQAGYLVKLIYLPLASPEEAIRRVGYRVQQGGHDVPEEVVRRRFHRSLTNFRTVYRDLVDVWHILDRRSGQLIPAEEGANR